MNGKDKPTRAVIYCRISRDDEGKEGAGLGVQRQEDDCRELARKLGWPVVGVFVDNDLDANGIKERPRYRDLLAAIGDGVADAVLAWHTDRVHRSPLELEEYVDICQPREVPTCTVKAGQLDFTTASGRMVARILGAVARQEVEHAIERMKAKKEQQRKAGLKNPSPRPYGYRWAGPAKLGLLEIVEPEAAHIRFAYAELLEARTPVEAIARKLNEAGSRTPAYEKRPAAKWTRRTLRQMLTRASSAGLIEHDGEVTRGTWEAIVTESEWRTVRAILADPSRRTSPGPKPAHLLTGIIRCGGCESKSFGVVQKSGRPVYQCRNRWCTSKDLVAADALVTAAIVGLLGKPESAPALHPREGVARLEAAKAGLRARLDEIARAVGKGWDMQQAMIASEEPQAELAEVEAKLASAYTGSVLDGIGGRDDAEERWFSLPIGRQRQIAAALIEEVMFWPTDRRGRLPRGAPRLDPETVGIRWSDLVTDRQPD